MFLIPLSLKITTEHHHYVLFGSERKFEMLLLILLGTAKTWHNVHMCKEWSNPWCTFTRSIFHIYISLSITKCLISKDAYLYLTNVLRVQVFSYTKIIENNMFASEKMSLQVFWICAPLIDVIRATLQPPESNKCALKILIESKANKDQT